MTFFSGRETRRLILFDRLSDMGHHASILAGIERKLDDLIRRVGNLESGQANIIQNFWTMAAADAQMLGFV